MVRARHTDLVDEICMVRARHTVLIDEICMVRARHTDLVDRICMVRTRHTYLVDGICMVRAENKDLVDGICMPRLGKVTLLLVQDKHPQKNAQICFSSETLIAFNSAIRQRAAEYYLQKNRKMFGNTRKCIYLCAE